MNVYIFKTSLKKQNIKTIKPILDKAFPNVKWNIDFDDFDNILRIESEKNISISVCTCLTNIGFECLELH